jgi:serine phosphatase RsbU (regulator of sigma subunit)
MASVKAMLPFLAANRSVAGTLAELNRRLVAELGPREFVALSYARFDPATGDVEFANAGLPDPYLLAGRAAPVPVVAPGPRLPLGALAGVAHQTVSLRLERGDRLVFLTDGLPEAPVAATGEPFGYTAFEGALMAAAEGAQVDLLENLVGTVESLVRLPRDDDWTVVSLKRLPQAAG